MANRRDLHVGLDADDRGFGSAFEDAQEKTRALDRELAKLERQMAAEEKVTTRSAAAVDRFGKAQDKAALAAHRLGLEAKRAAEQAEKAEVRAAAAAEAATKGLLDEAKAAALAARADDKVERAALKAAEAHRAQAHAADEAADQERQLARDAALAATAERLGALKASGQIKEHNALVRRTREEYGDLEGVAKGAFNEVETVGSRAFGSVSNAASSLASSGPGSIALVVAALAAVPFVALTATSAISLGVGGALGGLGLMATKSDKEVQAALHATTSHIKTETRKISAPFKQTWLDIAAAGREAFDGLEPEIAADLAKLAPAIGTFAHEAGYALTLLGPGFDAATNAADRLLGELGPRLPEITGNLGHSIEIMADSATKSAPAFANMMVSISQVLPVAAHLLDLAVKVAPAVNLMYAAISDGTGAVNFLLRGVGLAGDGMTSMFVKIPPKASAAAASMSALQKDMKTLASAEASATDKANALNDAFERLLNPAEAVFTDTAKLKDSVGELVKALKKSHGSLTDNTTAGRAAKQAFTGMIDGAKGLASDMLNSGKSIDQVQAKLNPYIHTMYAAAGSNQQARALVDAFVRSLGAVPPKKGTTLTLEDREFLSKLHAAQGLRIDPKTGLLKGDNADYFNTWLKTNGLKINPKTGRFLGNNADYYNKWLSANHLHIDPKTGVIKGNTSAFWSAVHGIPSVVGNRQINVRYVPVNSANEPGTTRHASGGIDRYAAGGVRRDLDPFVATKPTVLFGETETGGEAFIPLGRQKRARSTMLLSDVAKMFGLAVVKPMAEGGVLRDGLRAFADGGTTSDASLSEVLQHWTDTKSPTTKTQVDAAVRARKTQINQLRNAEDALYRARHARHKSARDIAAAERRVAAEREDVAAATKKLADVEQRYKYGKLSPVNKLSSALGLSIKDTGAFIANLTTLANRGYGVLAQHLLAQGDTTAEKTAADAVKMSNSKLGGLQKQVQQADQQQTTLANLGGILTVKSAMTSGANTWDQLIAATGLAPNDLAASLKLMSADLAKTAAGQALLAMMKAHGFAHGGPIGGPPGIDNVPLWGTAGEYVVRKEPAAANRPLLDAMNTGRPIRIPSGTVRGGDGANAGRPVVINVYARDSQSALATAQATAHELGWEMKKGGN